MADKIEVKLKTVIYESKEIAHEDWDELVAYYRDRLARSFNLPGIQTDVSQNHWLTNYMEFCNGQKTNDERHQEDAN